MCRTLLGIKQYLPWWVKLWGKIFLSRMPVSSSTWKKVGIFEHSQDDNQKYVADTFLKAKKLLGNRKGYTCLELGPGDWLGTVIVAKAYGAKKTYLVDVGRFARWELDYYREFMTLCPKDLLQDLDLSNEQLMLRSCAAEYLTEGLDSLGKIPSESVDLVFSSAVLEHIRREEFEDTMRELCRILKKCGRVFHGVDLQDHLGGGLNHLRFSPGFWESDWIYESGVYTNRTRFEEMVGIMENCGFTLLKYRSEKWTEPVLPRVKMDKSFRALPGEEFLIKTFEVELGVD